MLLNVFNIAYIFFPFKFFLFFIRHKLVLFQYDHFILDDVVLHSICMQQM